MKVSLASLTDDSSNVETFRLPKLLRATLVAHATTVGHGSGFHVLDGWTGWEEQHLSCDRYFPEAYAVFLNGALNATNTSAPTAVQASLNAPQLRFSGVHRPSDWYSINLTEAVGEQWVHRESMAATANDPPSLSLVWRAANEKVPHAAFDSSEAENDQPCLLLEFMPAP
jgi:hypothetical protein